MLATVVGLVLVIGAVSTMVEIERSRDEVRRRDEAVLAEAVAGVNMVLDVLRTTATAQALAGPEGTSVEEDRLEAYAAALMAQPAISSVAYQVRVTADDRPAFERAIGSPITERSPEGDLVEADERAEYFPIVWRIPPPERPIIGFDLLSEARRRAAYLHAQATGEPAVSAPLQLAASGDLGVLVMMPLMPLAAPDPSIPIGMLTVGYFADELTAAIVNRLPPGASLRIADDGQPVVEVGEVGANDVSERVEMAGRVWDITVRQPQRVSLGAAVLLGMLSVGVAVLLAIVGWILVHQRRDVEHARSRVAHLQSSTAGFARSRTPEEIRTIAIEHAAAMATGSAVWVRLTADGCERVMSAGSASRRLDDDLFEAVVRDALTEPESPPVSEVLVDGRLLAIFVVAERDDTREVVVIDPSNRRVHGADIENCASMFVVMAAALRRAEAHQRERHVAVTLQQQLLSPPVMPRIDGLEIAATYRPASGDALVGGDWYDVIPVDSRRVVVSVGDVVGHGVRAAGAMGILRTASRTLADFFSPSQILDHLDRLAATTPEARMTTVLVAEFDLDEDVLRYAAAGHPPPVLIRGDDAEPLWGGRGAPLHLPPDDGRILAVHEIQAGDRFLLFTDGLFEQHRAGFDSSLQALCAAAAATRSLDGAAACDELVSLLVGTAPNDDVALTIITVDG